MKPDGQIKALLAAIAAGLFLNAAVALLPGAHADVPASVQRVEIVNWPARLVGDEPRAPLPVYVMNGKVPNERVPSIPVMVVNQRYN